MFERATRLKLRFTTTKGAISVEDLWDVALTSRSGFDLDTIARGLHKKIRDSDEVSFIEPVKKTGDHDSLKFEIVKHIISIKLVAKKAREEAVAKKAYKESLLEVIKDKKADAIKAKPLEELEKEFDNL